MNKNTNSGNNNNRRQNFNNNNTNNTTNNTNNTGNDAPVRGNYQNQGFNQRRGGDFNNNRFNDSRPNNYENNFNNSSKRNKITFTRDGMNLVCNVKRNTVDDKLPYISFEIKERTEEKPNEIKSDGEPLVNNQRFILINSFQLSKILLLNPKATVGDKLEQISFVQKNRTLNINQQKDNKYVFTLELHMEGQEKTTSQVELSAEDMLFIKLFVQSNFNELNRI